MEPDEEYWVVLEVAICGFYGDNVVVILMEAACDC